MEKEKIRYKDLSVWLKVAIVCSLIEGVFLAISFVMGFIEGIMGA